MSPLLRDNIPKPAWSPCDCCEDFWCRLHNKHAFECQCPPIDEWDRDPYDPWPRGLEDYDTDKGDAEC